MSDVPHYLGQTVWYEGAHGTETAIIVGLNGEPDTHRVDLAAWSCVSLREMCIHPGWHLVPKVPFGTEKGTWRFVEKPRP